MELDQQRTREECNKKKILDTKSKHKTKPVAQPPPLKKQTASKEVQCLLISQSTKKLASPKPTIKDKVEMNADLDIDSYMGNLLNQMNKIDPRDANLLEKTKKTVKMSK